MSTYEHNANTNVKPVGWLEKHLGMGAIVYFLISTITFGIYSIVFAFKITRLLSEMSADIGKNDGKLRQQLLTSLYGVIAYIVGLFLSGVSAFFGIIALIGLGVAIVQGIRWAYTARAMMVDYYAHAHGFPVSINGFLLFFFPNIMLLITANSAERTQQLHQQVR